MAYPTLGLTILQRRREWIQLLPKEPPILVPKPPPEAPTREGGGVLTPEGPLRPEAPVSPAPPVNHRYLPPVPMEPAVPPAPPAPPAPEVVKKLALPALAVLGFLFLR